MKTIIYIRSSCIYNDSRATKEIKALLEKKYFLHILCWDKNGIAEEKNKTVFESENITFHYFKKTIIGGIGLKKINILFGWFIWLRRQINNIKNISAIHACDLDAAAAILDLVKRKKIPFVYDIYDYYVDAHNIPSFLIRIVERREIKAINISTATIICTEERREQISKSSPKRVLILYNSPESFDHIIFKPKYDYVYCGALCSQRLILEILNEYHNHQNFKFYFAGSGEYSSMCVELSKKFPNFTYGGEISYDEVLKKELSSRCLSAIYEPTKRNHRLCAPNKFYEALCLGKPIIVCKNTGIDKVIKEETLGISINYDALEFYEALQDICLSQKTNTLFNCNHAKEIFDNKYDWKLMKRRLQNLYFDIFNNYNTKK